MEDERNYKTTRSFRLSTWGYSWGTPLLHSIAQRLSQLGISANALTILGFILCLAVGIFLSLGYVRYAGLILFFAGILDIIDGQLAKVTNSCSSSGAFLDSTLDQIGDVFIYAGLTWHLLKQGLEVEVLLATLILGGALIVSYIKAKADALGVQCKVGPVGRFERTLLTIVGFIVNKTTILLWVLLISICFTVIRRFTLGIGQLREAEHMTILEEYRKT